MYTVLLPTDVIPIAVNKYINNLTQRKTTADSKKESDTIVGYGECQSV